MVRRVGQILARAGGIDGVEEVFFSVAPSVAGAAGTLLIFSLAAAGWWTLRTPASPTERQALAALTTWLAGALALPILGHRLLGALLAIHCFSIFAAGAAVLLAAPFALARRRFLAGALFACVLAANFTALPAAARSGDEPLRPAAAWIDQRIGPDDLVVGVAWFVIDGYRWYGAGRPSAGFPVDFRERSSQFRLQPGVAERADLSPFRIALAGRERVALLLSHTAWNGVDRGVELLQSELAANGFALEAENGWPLFGDNPSVRAQIWRRFPPGVQHP
jgi:hypothetical protein